MLSTLRSRKSRIREKCRITFDRLRAIIRFLKVGGWNTRGTPTKKRRTPDAGAIPLDESNVALSTRPGGAAPIDPSPNIIPISGTYGPENFPASPPTEGQPRLRSGRHEIGPSSMRHQLESDSKESFFTQDVDIHVANGDGRKIPYRAKLDTGSEVNMMAPNVREDLGYNLGPYDRSLEWFHSHSVEPLGQVEGVEFNFIGLPKTYEEEFLVIDTEEFDVLIGEPFIRRHRLYIRNEDVLPRSAGG